MKKVCLALACLAFGGVASALTVTWQWSPLEVSLVQGSSYYMVYSTNADLTAEQVVALASRGEYGKTTTAIGSTWGSTLDSSTVNVDGITAAVTPGAGDQTGMGVPVGDSTAWAIFDDPSFPGDTVSASEGYLYFVIFNDVVASATQFAVGKTDGPVSVSENGQVAEPGSGVPLEFLAPVWLGGTHRAAPEPTVLALLALGIAGVALRRRVR